jgi:hypothetical protein
LNTNQDSNSGFDRADLVLIWFHFSLLQSPSWESRSWAAELCSAWTSQQWAPGRGRISAKVNLRELVDMSASSNGSEQKQIYVTLTGLPLSFHFEWPFRRSTSGADFFFLHADIRLENSAGLHAPVAVNLSATVREVLPSLEPKDVEDPVINALRKEVDRRQLEFVKSGKLVPVQFSSRHFDFKRNKWMFGKASDEEIALLLKRKAYWQTRLVGGAVWITDPAEVLYAETSTEHLLDLARKLQTQGLIKLEGERATATSLLMEQDANFETDMRAALEELEKKHAFERG